MKRDATSDLSQIDAEFEPKRLDKLRLVPWSFQINAVSQTSNARIVVSKYHRKCRPPVLTFINLAPGNRILVYYDDFTRI